MDNDEFSKEFQLLNEKTDELIELHGVQRNITHETYIRLVVFRKLLKNFMHDEDVEEYVTKYRTSDNKHSFDFTVGTRTVLDGVGGKAGHKGKESGKQGNDQ